MKSPELKAHSLVSIRTVTVLALLLAMATPQTSLARRRHHGHSGGSSCGGQTLSASIYHLKGNAKMNGAAMNAKGQIVGADGKNKGCTAANGQRSAKGAGGCLTPFFSVAGDSSQYNLGDIIYIPDIAKSKISVPGASHHPGYFMVQDRGGAIKGSGRFDFFTGTYGSDDAKNPFSSHGSFRDMKDRHVCSHKFYVIRKGSGSCVRIPGEGGSADRCVSYNQAKSELDQAIGGKGTMSLASNDSAYMTQ